MRQLTKKLEEQLCLKYQNIKKSNVKISIRLPETMNDTLKKIAEKENMSFNNVIVSCIQNSLDQIDLTKYEDSNEKINV